MRGSGSMTPEEVAEYCRATGQAVPPGVAGLAGRGPKVPRSRLTLDFGELYGHAVLTVEFDATSLGEWRSWMLDRAASMGGDVLSDAIPV